MIDDTVDVGDINIYKKFMDKQGIAEGSETIPYGDAIPLEYNIVFLNGGNKSSHIGFLRLVLQNKQKQSSVSFNKGCYLGQELVAKTHYTGVVRKRIMSIELISNEYVEWSSWLLRRLFKTFVNLFEIIEGLVLRSKTTRIF
jgi:folate-binding Fe-S cluster repair protein YgfZ